MEAMDSGRLRESMKPSALARLVSLSSSEEKLFSALRAASRRHGQARRVGLPSRRRAEPVGRARARFARVGVSLRRRAAYTRHRAANVSSASLTCARVSARVDLTTNRETPQTAL